jgi:Putative mono-oxygenase ydhR
MNHKVMAEGLHYTGGQENSSDGAKLAPSIFGLPEDTMIVTIVTFQLAKPATLAEIAKTFKATAPKYQGIPGLLRKNYWLSEDGRRAGGIYVWASRADADRVYTAEWKKFVEGKYGSAPQIEYLHSPVMVDNREGTISVAA